MAVKLKWAWLGVALPCFLISFIAYGCHIFVFSSRLSYNEQIWFEACVSMIWLSYYLAIVTPPGSPPNGYELPNGNDDLQSGKEATPRRAWKKWCSKCQLYKPERSHHCKTCRVCVLKMDHHCPWTMNCIGYNNMPHFLRFLIWVFYTTGFVFWQLSKVLYTYYENRNLPSYLFSVKELSFTIVLYFFDLLVFFTITMMLLRTLHSIIISGMTTIESWDKERLESQFYSKPMWARIRRNYQLIHGEPMPRLTSWKASPLSDIELEDLDDVTADPSKREEQESISLPKESNEGVLPFEFTIEDLVFPYTFSPFYNLTLSMGPIYTWLWPWGTPMGHHHGDGITFERNTDEQEDQLDLPWPPDGQDQDDVIIDKLQGESSYIDNENEEVIVAKKSIGYYRSLLDPRLNLERSEWMNDFGETLDDFGVDLESENSSKLTQRPVKT